MALDFSGYVPGMVNIGPAYKPPTVTQELISLRAMICELQNKIADMDPDEIAGLRTDLDVLQVTVNNINTELGDIGGDITVINTDISGLSGDLSALQAALDALDTDVDRLQTELETLDGELDALAGTVADQADEIAGKADANTDGAALQAMGIPYGEVDATSTATAFTATVPGITELKNGTIMLLKNGVVTSASGFTININGLGAKPSYTNLAEATRDTTLFNIAYTMLFIYDEDRVAGGCWICYRGYDANTNTIGYQLRTNSSRWVMAERVYRYRLLFASADGTKLVPANNGTSTSATSAKTPSTLPIDPFGPIIYYGTTTSVAAGSMPGAAYMWTQYVATIGYSFTPVAMTAWLPVYLKCRPQADGSAVIDPTTPYTQTLPASADGYIYIYLGQAVSATTFELVPQHPVYYYRDGIRLWTGGGSGTVILDTAWNISGSVSSATATEAVEDFTELEILVRGPYSGYISGNQIYQYRTFRVPVSAGGFVIRDVITANMSDNIIEIGWSGTALSQQNSTSPLVAGYSIEKITGY